MVVVVAHGVVCCIVEGGVSEIPRRISEGVLPYRNLLNFYPAADTPTALMTGALPQPALQSLRLFASCR